MKRCISLFFFLFACGYLQALDIKDGDIIFHRSQTRQSYAIAAATHSEYTHMGIIFFENEFPYVFEAVQPVKKTPLKEWIERGKNKHYVVKRLEKFDSTKLPQVRTEVLKMLGKDYDWLFDWSNEKIYCSELVWKAYYKATGIQIGKLKKLQDFDLNHKIVRKIMKERYGKNIPKDMKVISPSDIFHSELLITILTKG